jgi:hypothetical protein
MVLAGCDSEFFEEAFFDAHLTFSTHFLFAAKGFYVHPELSGSFYEIGPFVDETPACRRLEDYHMLLVFHS